MEQLYQSRYTGPEIDRRLGLMAGNFLWIKWSDTFPVATMLDEPGPYIGIYAGESNDPPADPAEYKWYLNKGNDGSPGPKGDKGDPGDKGDTGDTGDQGPKGDKGEAKSGVYIDEEPPTDEDVKVWICPTGGFDIMPTMTQSEYDAIPPDDIDNDVLYVVVPDEV